MSDHVTTTTTTSTSVKTATSTEANCETELKQRLVAENAKTPAATNGFPKTNGQPLVSAADGEIKVIQLKHHVNLDEYTKNFKGDKIFGIQFKAPLKWGNIVLISLYHLYFVYAYLTYPILNVNWKSVIFGK